ncbi:hypothetical protein [Sulfuracidifex metallicus]|uniref:hypothetical protein n=1 Tax=Sulfuracidifex metallicus TaxID=47303 RepID=UPI0022727B78|nr:hypothetical protein [Sulfuracidifex metallicus]MCY0850457.1 hypothetical protein [Sulfuracidifex metallicus]
MSNRIYPVKLKLIWFLLRSRFSVPLILIYSLGIIFAVVEFYFSIEAYFGINNLAEVYARNLTFMNIYFLFGTIPLAFLTPTPTKADAFNVFTLPYPMEEMYNNWFGFQFFYRLLFLGFFSAAFQVDVLSTFGLPFVLEYSLTGAFLSSVNMVNRKMRPLFYGGQLAEALSFAFLPTLVSMGISTLITLVSMTTYLLMESRYDPVEFLSTLFSANNREVGQDRVIVSSSGEKALIINRLKNPLLVLTFNVSGQLKIIKPGINGRVIMFLLSIAGGIFTLMMSTFLRNYLNVLGGYYIVGLAFYLIFIFMVQWLVVGTLAFERPWLGVQIFSARRYFRDVHISNLTNMTLAWVVILAFSMISSLFVSLKILFLAILILPSSWLLYLISFVASASSLPNVQTMVDESQPYISTVRNVVGISFLNFVPFFVILVTSEIAGFVSTFTFMEISLAETLAIFAIVWGIIATGIYYNSLLRVMALKGYF